VGHISINASDLRFQARGSNLEKATVYPVRCF